MHEQESPLSGMTVKIKESIEHPQFKGFGGSEIVIEDWWDRATGKSWMFSDGNPACIVYALRTGLSKTPPPIDDEVLYGHSKNGLGHLVHVTEIEEIK